MRAFDEFKHMGVPFWAIIRFVSENLGYTEQDKGVVKAYTAKKVEKLCLKNQINITEETIRDVVSYSEMRAELLNKYAQSMLMDAATAGKEFAKWAEFHHINHLRCRLPMKRSL